MKTILRLSVLVLLSIPVLAKAQEVNYRSAYTNFHVGPKIEFEKDAFKTFDFKLATEESILSTSAVEEKKREFEKYNYSLNFNGLQQINGQNSIGDLHILVLLRSYVAQSSFSKTGGVMTAKVKLYTSVRTADGHELYNKPYRNDTLTTFYGKGLTIDSVSTLSVQNAIQRSLKEFDYKINGYDSYTKVVLADLDDVKKLPELKAFEEHTDNLLKLLRKDDLSGFCSVAEKYLPLWEAQANNYADKNAEEVKRAAYQNILTYYLIKGEYEKAKPIIDAYKPIDKTIKEMMGLIKYKNSEELEKRIAELSGAKEFIKLIPNDKRLSLDKAFEDMVFYKKTGTFTVDDKKNAGTYTGTIYVKFPSPTEELDQSGIGQIGAKDCDVIIKYNENNVEKQISTVLSKIESMKDNEGKNYIVIKAGANFMGDMTAISIASNSYILMQETYSSPKISLYRIVAPMEKGGQSSFLVRKPGDDKGVRTSLVNFKKNLVEYFSDCPKAVDMINNSKYYSGDIEKIVAEYSNCSNS